MHFWQAMWIWITGHYTICPELRFLSAKSICCTSDFCHLMSKIFVFHFSFSYEHARNRYMILKKSRWTVNHRLQFCVQEKAFPPSSATSPLKHLFSSDIVSSTLPDRKYHLDSISFSNIFPFYSWKHCSEDHYDFLFFIRFFFNSKYILNFAGSILYTLYLYWLNN